MCLAETVPVAGRTTPPDGGLDGGGIVAQRRDRLDEMGTLYRQPRPVCPEQPAAFRALAAQPADSGPGVVWRTGSGRAGGFPGPPGLLPGAGHDDAVGDLLRRVCRAGVSGTDDSLGLEGHGTSQRQRGVCGLPGIVGPAEASAGRAEGPSAGRSRLRSP